MENAVYHISLDLHEIGVQLSLKAKAYDTARVISCALTENGRPYSITEDCYAVFTAKKPDGNILFNTAQIIGNRILYPFTVNTVNAPGEVLCELRLYNGSGKLLTSPRFSIFVDETVYTDGQVTQSSSEFTALTELMSEVIRVLGEVPSPVLYGQAQTLTDGQKARARENIGAAAAAVLTGYLLKTEIAAWAKEATKPRYDAAEIRGQFFVGDQQPDNVEDAIFAIVDCMGDLSGLDTTAKSSLVNAINSLKAYIDGKTGNLASLTTTAKNNLVAAINEVAQKVFVVPCSITNGSIQPSVTSDITYAEVSAAIQAGKRIVCSAVIDGSQTVISTAYAYSGTGKSIPFTVILGNEQYFIALTTADQWICTKTTAQDTGNMISNLFQTGIIAAKYPSANAVIDFVNTVVAGAIGDAIGDEY